MPYRLRLYQPEWKALVTVTDLAVDQSKNSSGLRNDKEAQSIYAALEMLTTA